MRLKARRDKIEPEVIEIFQWHGFAVYSISSLGFSDLVIADDKVVALIEVKSGKAGKLTPAQIRFHEKFPNEHLYIVRSAGEAQELADKLRGVK